jgi:hypothetical protein
MPERSRGLGESWIELGEVNTSPEAHPVGVVGLWRSLQWQDWASFRAHFKLKPPLREPASPYSRAERALLRSHIFTSVI